MNKEKSYKKLSSAKPNKISEGLRTPQINEKFGRSLLPFVMRNFNFVGFLVGRVKVTSKMFHVFFASSEKRSFSLKTLFSAICP